MTNRRKTATKPLGLSAILIAVLAISSPVSACGTCATAIADAGLPPISLWALLGLSWMLLTALLGAWHRAKVPGHPRLVWTLVILLVSGFLAASSVGMGIGLLLLLPPFISFGFAVFEPPEQFPNPSLRQNVRTLGYLATAAFVVLAGFTYHIRTTRTQGEYIIQWGSTPLATAYLKNLKHQPNGLQDLRYVLQHGNDRMVREAAPQLAEIGDHSDLIHFEELISRACAESWDEGTLTLIHLERMVLNEKHDPKSTTFNPPGTGLCPPGARPLR